MLFFVSRYKLDKILYIFRFEVRCICYLRPEYDDEDKLSDDPVNPMVEVLVIIVVVFGGGNNRGSKHLKRSIK